MNDTPFKVLSLDERQGKLICNNLEPLHTRNMKTCGPCIIRIVIGQKGRDHISPFHIRKAKA